MLLLSIWEHTSFYTIFDTHCKVTKFLTFKALQFLREVLFVPVFLVFHIFLDRKYEIVKKFEEC